MKPSEQQAAAAAERLSKAIELTTEQKVDQFAQDWFWKQENKARLARLENAAKAFRAQYANSDPASPFKLAGKDYILLIGPKENQRKVNVVKAIKLWTGKRLRELFTIPLEALEKLVGKEEAAKAIETSRTGSRDLTPIPKEKLAA